MNKRNAFIVYTKYQMFVTMNLIKTRYLSDINDLFLICDMVDSIDVSELNSIGIFTNIYKINLWGKITRFKKVKVYVSSNELNGYVDLLCGRDNLNQIKYDSCFCSVLTNLFTSIMLTKNKKADIYIFEDGMATYNKFACSKLYNYSWKTLFVRYLLGVGGKVKIAGVFVFRPDIAIEDEYPIYQILISEMKSLYDVMRKIFRCEELDQLEQCKFIYFEQPNETFIDNYLDIEEYITDVLFSFKSQTVMRLHPRDLGRAEFYSEYKCENSGMWELQLANLDVEDKVLIGPFSTAQVTPKILYDQEPYIIFTYQLYHDFFGSETSNIEDLIGRIRGIYRNPEKIFVVKSKAELKEILENLGNDK